MRLRTKISGLMAAILVIAVTIAALTPPTIWWASRLFTPEVGSFCLAALLARAGPRRLRKMGPGFAIFGLTYFAANRYCTDYNTRYLPVPLIIELTIMHFDSPDEDLEANGFSCQVACSIATLVFAGVGGAVGRYLDIRQRQAEGTEPVSDSHGAVPPM